MNLTPYEKEQEQLLLNFLKDKERTSQSVEFIISSACNQSCEYCYLYKHGKEMYPPESNNPQNIVKNFRLLLTWLEENNFEFTNYDMFSGEFFALNIWKDIFEIIYEFNINNTKEKVIGIPTNGSFLLDDEQTQEIEEWIKKFREVNIDLYLSISVDGPQELEAIERPMKNKKVKDQNNFYQKYSDFRKKHHLTGHPMVTRKFVENYKENYDWWIDTLVNDDIKTFNFDGKEIYNIPMFLEVRDPEQWDEESLANLKKLYNYIADKDFEVLHNKNVEDFAYHFFDFNTDDSLRESSGDYTHIQPYIIGFPYMQFRLPCSIQGGPVFRVGDLAYVPCHRTCYPNHIYGKFIVENNQIVGMKAEHPALAFKIKTLNPNRSILKCSDCPINFFCLKGCLGSQYEHTNDMFCAQDEICEMYRVKYKTIHEIALRYGLYNWLNLNMKIGKERRDFVNYVRKYLEQL